MRFLLVASVALMVAGAAAISVRAQAPSTAEAAAEFAASHNAMMAGMHGQGVAYSGDPDLDFVSQMIPHHQGAIDMAKVELKYGTDAEVRKLAWGIISAQESEIAQMTKWKQVHAVAVSPDAAAVQAGLEASNRKMMAAMGADHGHAGKVDLMFLAMMIPHHHGAIDMAAVERTYGKDAEIRALADKIRADQLAEIIVMMELLEAGGHH